MATAGQIKGFGEVLGGDDTFRVPEFQRNFAWGEKDIVPLLEDIQDLVEMGGKHFIGSLIVLHDEYAENERLVIDGQQRLTSLFVILASIRDYLDLQVNDPTLHLADDFTLDLKQQVSNLLFVFDPSTGAKEPRLTAHPRVNDHFQAAIMAAPIANRPQLYGGDGKDRLPLLKVSEAVKHWILKHYSGEQDEQQRLKKLHKLLRAVTSQLTLMTITADDMNESYDVFKSLNSRGKPLDQADLIKSELFRILTKGLSKVDRQIKSAELELDWSVVLQNLGKVSMDDFLRHYLVSTTNTSIRSSEIFRVFSSKFVDVKGNLAAEKSIAKALLGELIEASETYGAIIRGTASKKTETNEKLKFLNSWGTKVTRVLLLAIFDKSLNISEELRFNYVELLETLTVRWNLTGGNAQVFENLLQGTAIELRDGKKSFDEVVEQMRVQMPTDDSFKASFHNTGKGARAILVLSYLDSVALGSAITVDPALYQLDYIAPKEQTEEWRKILFPQEQANIDQEYRASVEKWGNLVLLDKSETKPKDSLDFESKKVSAEEHRGYQNSDFLLTSEVAQHEKWTRTEITERAQKIGELAAETWKV